MKRILLVEDDPHMALGLKDNLELDGYEVLTAADGEEGLRKAIRHRPDVIILDVMLPRLGGIDVCQAIRERGLAMPILMLTARTQEADKVLGLTVGADDYVTKPFSINELLARIRALIRRAHARVAKPSRYRFGEVEVDFQRQVAEVGGAPLALTSLEFETLKYLVERRGEPVTREQLLTDVWGYRDIGSTRAVDNLIARLRKKLESDPAAPAHLLTVHGVGYKFVD